MNIATEHVQEAVDGVRTTYWRTADRLNCHAAIYAPPAMGEPQNPSATPVICIPGLTRNGADFQNLAQTLANQGRTVYALTLRGRGRSERDQTYLNYHPEQYRDDVLAALDAFDIDAAIFIGTSLGGIVTMLTAKTAPDRIAKAILNDVGPRLAPEGLARIGALLADAKPSDGSFENALAAVKRHNLAAFPDADDAFWRKFVERTYRQSENGEWAPDYDPNIARALAELGPGADLWPGFEALKDIPTMLVRGGVSDLMTDDIAEEMRARRPDLKDVIVSGVGHAPMLDEPEALSAVTAFLET